MIDRHLTSEKLEEQFLSLPKDIQNAITSNAILDVVGEIGKNRGLHIDQTGVLAEETALLMLGKRVWTVSPRGWKSRSECLPISQMQLSKT